MKHVLIVTLPGSEPQQFELKGKRIGLGREVDNDISLNVEAVSSSHLEFRKTDDGYHLEDQNSTNGTRVNGKVTQVTTLADGDRLLIAETVPAHYLVLAEDETWEAGAAEGSDADRKVAGEYAAMSDRLEKLEANIEAKTEEAAALESRLVELRANYQQNLAEYGEAQLALEKLKTEVESRKRLGNLSEEEMQKLEQDLMHRTKRVKVMSTDLATKQEEISQLESAAPVPAPKQAVPSLPKKAMPPGPTIPLRKHAVARAKTIPLTRGSASLPPRMIVKKKRES